MNVPLNELIAALPRDDSGGERMFVRIRKTCFATATHVRREDEEE